MRQGKHLLLLSLIASIFCSCTFSARPVWIEDEKKTAERAVEQFHKRINEEQYEAIYDDAHDVFKTANEKNLILPTMKRTHERTGKVIQVTDHWINYVAHDPVPVRAVYNIKCENGDFSEWFAFAISGDGSKALLAQYQQFPGSSPSPKFEKQEGK